MFGPQDSSSKFCEVDYSIGFIYSRASFASCRLHSGRSFVVPPSGGSSFAFRSTALQAEVLLRFVVPPLGGSSLSFVVPPFQAEVLGVRIPARTRNYEAFDSDALEDSNDGFRLDAAKRSVIQYGSTRG
jgi:hypothetical protein